MPLKDLFASILRTAVPAGVGFLLTFAARKWGIVLDEATSAQVSMVVTAFAGTAYYALVRVAETRWKWASWLLGWNVPPTYEADNR